MRYSIIGFYSNGGRAHMFDRDDIEKEPNEIESFRDSEEEKLQYHTRDSLAYVEIYEMKKVP